MSATTLPSDEPPNMCCSQGVGEYLHDLARRCASDRDVLPELRQLSAACGLSIARLKTSLAKWRKTLARERGEGRP